MDNVEVPEIPAFELELHSLPDTLYLHFFDVIF